MSATNMNFRQDINGLRAFAVLAVVLYHFGVPGFSGGFVGVDIFFVISGFLMTGIIFRKVDADRFVLLDFYGDRGRRIVPALAVLCLALMIMGWFLLLPDDYSALGQHVRGSMTFWSNQIYNQEVGYFDADAHEKWLLHTWSLSVEWQFYILYPLLILLLRRYLPHGRARQALAVAALASFAWAVYLSTAAPTSAFYLLPTRSWEMLAGGLIFLFPLSLPPVQRVWLERAGFVLMLLSLFILDESDAWPGWLALLPVSGAACILIAARNDSWLTANPVAQWFGRVSYSLYLWHWPVVVGLNYFDLLDDMTWVAGGVVVSILFGYASYRLVEMPSSNLGRPQTGTRLGRLPVVPVSLALIVVVGALGAVLEFDDGVPQKFRAINNDAKALFLVKYQDMHGDLSTAYHLECDFFDAETRLSKTRIADSCTRNIHGRAFFLWGDSHAQALSLGLRQTFRKRAIAQVATSGCRPSLGPQLHPALFDNKCDFSNAFARQEIRRLKPEIVIMAQAEGHEETDWSAIARYLHSVGVKRVILVGPVPQWRPSLPLVVSKRHWQEHSDMIEDDGLDNDIMVTDSLLQQRYGQSGADTEKTGGLEYVSVISALCKGDECLAYVPGDGTLIAVDYGHLSPPGSIYVVRHVLAPAILNHEIRPAPK